MARRLYTITDSISHINNLTHSLNKNDVINIERKISAIFPYLYKKFNNSKYIISLYKRKDAIGFCLLKKYEGLPEGGRASRNFMEIKPNLKFEFFRRNFKAEHPGFDAINFEKFLRMDLDEFVVIFLSSAQSRAEHFDDFIY